MNINKAISRYTGAKTIRIDREKAISNNRFGSQRSIASRNLVIDLSRRIRDEKLRSGNARIILPEMSWLSAVILLLHFTPHTVPIIKPQEAFWEKLED
jgi:hypothetical protein